MEADGILNSFLSAPAISAAKMQTRCQPNTDVQLATAEAGDGSWHLHISQQVPTGDGSGHHSLAADTNPLAAVIRLKERALHALALLLVLITC